MEAKGSEVKCGTPWLDFPFAFAATEKKTSVWMRPIENGVDIDFFHLTFFGPLEFELGKFLLLILYFGFRIDGAVGCALPDPSGLILALVVPPPLEPVLRNHRMDLGLLLLDLILVPFLSIPSHLRLASCCWSCRTSSVVRVVAWFRLFCCLSVISA